MRSRHTALIVTGLIVGLASWVARSDAGPKACAEVADLVSQATAQYHIGDNLEEGGAAEYDKGVALAERAVGLDPNCADAYFALFVNLGRKAERAGKVAQLQVVGRLTDLLTKTLELDPLNAHAWEARGEMLTRLPWILGGSTAKGEQALERSAVLAPQWAKPALRLAELHWKNGDAPRAEREAEKARDLARAAADQDHLKEAELLLAEIRAAAH